MGKGKGKEFFENIKNSKFVDFVKDKAPHVLDLVGDVTGIQAINNVADLIGSDDSISQTDKDIILAEYANEKSSLELAYSDRANARNMAIANINAKEWLTRNFAALLSSFVVLMASVFGLCLFFIEVPVGNEHLVQMFADAYLIGGFMVIMGFWFSSSIKKQD